MPAVITVLVAVFNLIFLADLLRTKLALTIPRASTTADEIMDRGVKGQCQGQGQELSEAVSAASTAVEAAVLSGDVSDDEDLTQSGSGVYLQEVKTEIPRHTQLLHTLKENKRGTWHFSCCAAGRLAASRHLHCHAQFHVDILRMRQSADVTHTDQGTRLRQHGRLPPPWPRDMARCVLERPLLFQKCCYGYASARSDRHQRFHHRKVSTGSLRDMYLSWRYINS